MVHFTRSRQKDRDSANFSAKKRDHFFKIIHSSIIQDQKLQIPRKFIGKFGKELSDVAVLEVPNGNAWRVRLRKADGEVWFQLGWQEFVEYHSIRTGHFLVFKYDGNSHFLVLIFDMSGTEIDYLSNSGNLEKPNRDGQCLVAKRKEIEKDTGEILDVTSKKDDLKELATTVRDIAVQCKRKKPIKTNAEAVGLHYLEQESRSVVFSFCERNQRTEPNTQDFSEQQDGGSMTVPEQHSDSRAIVRRVSTKDRKWAIKAAGEFKSKNPFFTVVMQQTYVRGKFALNVPYQFMKIYLTKKTDDITLRVSDGRTWPAQVFFYNGITKIYNGWAAFVKENNVEVGDVCVFELIANNHMVLNVSIFPSRQRCGIRPA